MFGYNLKSLSLQLAILFLLWLLLDVCIHQMLRCLVKYILISKWNPRRNAIRRWDELICAAIQLCFFIFIYFMQYSGSVNILIRWKYSGIYARIVRMFRIFHIISSSLKTEKKKQIKDYFWFNLLKNARIYELFSLRLTIEYVRNCYGHYIPTCCGHYLLICSGHCLVICSYHNLRIWSLVLIMLA